MAETIVNILGFDEFEINIVDQADTLINKKNAEDFIIIVPGDGVVVDTGIFDSSFDITFE